MRAIKSYLRRLLELDCECMWITGHRYPPLDQPCPLHHDQG